jgi:hypothetical protein
VSRKRLAENHRLIGDQEHAVERRMLRQADQLPDPAHMRERARAVSGSADRHLEEAQRLDEESGAAEGQPDSP